MTYVSFNMPNLFVLSALYKNDLYHIPKVFFLNGLIPLEAYFLCASSCMKQFTHIKVWLTNSAVNQSWYLYFLSPFMYFIITKEHPNNQKLSILSTAYGQVFLWNCGSAQWFIKMPSHNMHTFIVTQEWASARLF